MNAEKIYNVLASQRFADWFESEFVPSIQKGNGFNPKIKQDIESFFAVEDHAKALSREELARLTVPTQGKFVRFGPVSQVCIIAGQLIREAKQQFNEISKECQTAAEKFGINVLYIEELSDGSSLRMTFHP